MALRIDYYCRRLSLLIGAITLIAVALLLSIDAVPQIYPARSHETLAASSLVMIALAYLIYQFARRPPPMELLKAILLAVAFLFWAANQFWADSHLAPLFNDIAIALFVLDVFLVIAARRRVSQGSSLPETRLHPCAGSIQGAEGCIELCREGECSAAPASYE